MSERASGTMTDLGNLTARRPAEQKVFVFGIDIELAMSQAGVLWNAKAFIAGCTAVGLALSLALIFLIPVKYEATAVLMPPDAVSTANLANTAMLTQKATSSLGSIGSSIGSLLGGSGSGQMVVAALQTEALEDRMIKRFSLQDVYGIKTMRDTRKKLERRTDISEDVKSGLITIVVRDRDPKRAAAMANAYGEELENLLFDARVEGANKESNLLNQPLAAAKKQLDESVWQLSEFSSKNTTLDPEVQGKAMVDAASMLQGQLIASQAELRSLQQLYTSDNVRVQAARGQVDELTAQLEKLGGKELKPSQTGDHELYPSIRKLPLLDAQYLDLYRAMKIREATYEAFVSDVEMNKFMELDGGPKVQILSYATAPEKIEFPPRGVLAEISALAWLAISCGWVLWLSVIRKMALDDPRRQLALRLLAQLHLAGWGFLRTHNLERAVSESFARG